MFYIDITCCCQRLSGGLSARAASSPGEKPHTDGADLLIPNTTPLAWSKTSATSSPSPPDSTTSVSSPKTTASTQSDSTKIIGSDNLPSLTPNSPANSHSTIPTPEYPQLAAELVTPSLLPAMEQSTLGDLPMLSAFRAMSMLESLSKSLSSPSIIKE